MTKDEVATAISNGLWVEGVPNDKATAVAVINAFAEVVKEAVANGETVTIRGFGTFQPEHRPARKARDFKADLTIEVPARTIPVFRPSPEFKKRLRLISK